MEDSATACFWLRDCHVDPIAGRITRAGQSMQLGLHPVQVLLALSRHPQLTLSQGDIEQAVWGDTPTAADTLYRCIAQLRAALGDRSRQPRFIETVPRRGYRLIAPIHYASELLEADGISPNIRSTRHAHHCSQTRWLRTAACCVVALVLLGSGAWWLSSEHEHAARANANAAELSHFMEHVFASNDGRAAPAKPETAQQLLNRATQRLGADLQDQPQVRMQMLETIGRSYAHQHLGSSALPALEEALRIRRSSSNAPQPEVALTLATLAEALRDVNRFQDARRAYQESLDILRVTQHQPSRDFAATYADLGSLDIEQGRISQGMQTLETSLQRMRSIQGPYHSDTAGILVSIGHACECISELARAEQALQAAQRIYQTSTPALNPNRLAADNAAGQVLLQQQRFDEAAVVLQRTLTARQQLFGPEGVPIAETLSLLGSVRNGQGRLREAEDLKLAAVAALAPFGEAANLQRATIQLSLAALLLRTQQFARSEALLRKVIDVYQVTLPADHISRTSAEHYLGEALLEQKKYHEADSVLQTAIERMRRAEVPRWRIARSMSTLGEVLYREGKIEDARELLLESHVQLAADPTAKPMAKARAQQRVTTLLGRPTQWASALPRAVGALEP